ncbi:hypothetical protein [Pseudidiomarina salilacus]|uniref:hypothetical protein n=1 Tax=Pseudidiomarina salilacus TaxID=3384452 RepID=UPI003984E03F
MQNKFKLSGAATLLALAYSSVAFATPAEPVPNRTIVINGFAMSGPLLDEQMESPLEYPMTVRITEEPNPAYLVYSEPSFYAYRGVTKEISIEVRDDSEQLMFAQTLVNDPTFCESAGGEAEFEQFSDGEFESTSESATWGVVSCVEDSFAEYTQFVYLENSNMVFLDSQAITPSVMLPTLFETWENYPTLRAGETELFMVVQALGGENVRLSSQNESKSTQVDENFEFFFAFGRATSINYASDDADGDGISDEVDLCSASITDETVIFGGWLDSAVTNYVDANGCTIMDRYAQCTQEVEEQPTRFSRFQPRYSGPSYCEKQVSYGLVDEGIIDYTEARMLRDALYMSYRSQSR